MNLTEVRHDLGHRFGLRRPLRKTELARLVGRSDRYRTRRGEAPTSTQPFAGCRIAWRRPRLSFRPASQRQLVQKMHKLHPPATSPPFGWRLCSPLLTWSHIPQGVA